MYGDYTDNMTSRRTSNEPTQTETGQIYKERVNGPVYYVPCEVLRSSLHRRNRTITQITVRQTEAPEFNRIGSVA